MPRPGLSFGARPEHFVGVIDCRGVRAQATQACRASGDYVTQRRRCTEPVGHTLDSAASHDSVVEEECRLGYVRSGQSRTDN